MAEGPQLFPIQLRRTGIGEIHFECGSFGKAGVSLTKSVDLSAGVSDYDAAARTIHVLLTATSEATEGIQHKLRVTVLGEYFIPDIAKLPFPIEKLPQWAERNGAAVLLPFLRELLYSITQRTGFIPFLLPLIEVIPHKVMPPDAGHSPNSAGPAPVQTTPQKSTA